MRAKNLSTVEKLLHFRLKLVRSIGFIRLANSIIMTSPPSQTFSASTNGPRFHIALVRAVNQEQSRASLIRFRPGRQSRS